MAEDSNSNDNAVPTGFLENLKDGIVDTSRAVTNAVVEATDAMKTTITKLSSEFTAWREQDRASRSKAEMGGMQPPKDEPDPMDEVIKKGFFKLFKTKYFENIYKSLQGMLQSAGSFFMEMLEFFLFMAFIDPSGALLKSLITIFFKIFKMIIGIIISILPTAIKLMFEAVELLFDLVAEAFPDLFRALLSAFTQIADIIMKKFPGMIVIFKPIKEFFEKVAKSFEELMSGKMTLKGFIFDVIMDAFIAIGKSIWGAFFGGNSGKKDEEGKEVDDGGGFFKGMATLLGFFILGTKLLAPFLPLLTSLGKSILWLTTKVFPGLKPAIFNMLNRGLAMIGQGIKTLTMALLTNPIVLIALAIVAGLALIWIYKDKIVTFFEDLATKFQEFYSKLSTPMKFLVGMLMVLIHPIILVGLAIYGIAKGFQWLAGLDWEKLWDDIVIWFEEFPDKLIGYFWKLNDLFGEWWNSFVDGLSSYFDWWLKGGLLPYEDMADMGKEALALVGEGKGFITKFFDSMWDGINSWLDEEFPALWDEFTKNIMKLLDFMGVSRAWKNKIANFLETVKSWFKIENILRGLTFTGVGTLIFEGIVAGLQPLWNWISESVRGIMPDISFNSLNPFSKIDKDEEKAYEKLQATVETDNTLKQYVEDLKNSDKDKREVAAKALADSGRLGLTKEQLIDIGKSLNTKDPNSDKMVQLLDTISKGTIISTNGTPPTLKLVNN